MGHGTYRILRPDGSRLRSFGADSREEAIDEAVKAIGASENVTVADTAGGDITLSYEVAGDYMVVREVPGPWNRGDLLIAAYSSAEEGIDRGTIAVIMHVRGDGEMDLRVPSLDMTICYVRTFSPIWRPYP